jgi:type IV fimbrial biogenesis protein FimT
LNKTAGFTVLELMVVVAIVAILMAIGVPSYRYVTNANRIAGEVNGLLGDMQYARSEAIKQGLTVTACSSSDGASCNGTATTWQSGWIVFVDLNSSGTVDAGDTVLRVQKAFSGSDTFRADNAIKAVMFNREGFAMGLPNTVTVTLHDSTNTSNSTRCLEITVVGMLTTRTAGTGNCT